MVSIHAPAWGATPSSERYVPSHAVSIHAPAWGATSIGGTKLIQTGFNPRTRMGCDEQGWRVCQPACVSIHAPAWGAT